MIYATTKHPGRLDIGLGQWVNSIVYNPFLEEHCDAAQNRKGRDHNQNSFTMWLAGGGFKADRH
jgi:hypothetical protein